MKKKLIPLLLIGIITTGTLLYLRDTTKHGQRKSIGLAISLTGFASDFGKPAANAVSILKQKYPEVDFFVQNTKSNPSEGLQAVSLLLNARKTNIVYTDLSSIAAASIPLTENKGAVQVASVYLIDLLKRGRLTLRNLPSGSEESALVLQELTKLYPNLTRLASLTSNDEFGQSSFKGFQSAASKTGHKIIHLDSFTENSQTFDYVAGKAINSRPDAIYVSSLSESLGLIVKKLREQGFSGPILSTNAYSFPFIQNAAGKANYGIIYPDFPKPDPQNSFVRKYTETFNADPAPTAVMAYTALDFLISNWKDSSSPPDIRLLDGKSIQSPYGEVKLLNREFRYPMIVRYLNTKQI